MGAPWHKKEEAKTPNSAEREKARPLKPEPLNVSWCKIPQRCSRSFAVLKELYAGNGMVGYLAKERVDGKLVLSEAVQLLKLKGA